MHVPRHDQRRPARRPRGAVDVQAIGVEELDIDHPVVETANVTWLPYAGSAVVVVAVLALDTEGHYVAVSRGASTLTGYGRAELIGKSIFDTGLALNRRVSAGWEEFLARKQSAARTITLDRSGNAVSIQTEFATILPGLHAAAFAG